MVGIIDIINVGLFAAALRMARQACEVDGYKNPTYVDTLAAAYAATGRFDQAVATQQRAIDLIRESDRASEAPADHTEMIKDFTSRLKLYEAKRPYRKAAP